MDYLGIEIGGTKLQLALGDGQGTITAQWRGAVEPAAGSEGIRRQITAALPELLIGAGRTRRQIAAVGIGFGGPVDTASQCVIKSHQIDGWDDFPLAQWLGTLLDLPAVLGNDSDLAALAEALFGAGRGLSPVFYMNIGSGIGGGLIIDGRIYPGAGKGAAEIGHLRLTRQWDGTLQTHVLEEWASGWGIQHYVRQRLAEGAFPDSLLRGLPAVPPQQLTTAHVAQAARQGDALARHALARAHEALADALCHVIALLCPVRVIIGGGVALIGDDLLFEPLRQLVAQRVFTPFAGLTQILPAALGEAMVLHGALVLARQHRPPG